VVVNIGEAAGAGALAISIADRVMMLEHAVLSVSGFATSGQAPHAPAGQTFLTATLSSRDCLRLGMIDSVVPEPAGGAHLDPNAAAQHLRLAVIHALSDLSGIGPRRLLDERSRKLRHLGLGTPAGREALRLEIVQLQELQQTVGRSIEELRERIEHYQLGLPSLPSLPQRPPMPHVALPVFPSLPTIKRPTVNRAEISGLAVRLAATGRGIAGRVSEVRESVTSAYEERKSSGDNQDAGEGHSRMAE
jgi:Acetyl co-enzyme A carboxylase carboxyltransferase-like